MKYKTKMRELTLYKVVNFIFLAYAWFLGAMATTGIVYIIYGLASGEVDTTNLTFGVFDTLGY
jgi:hypothetical protein